MSFAIRTSLIQMCLKIWLLREKEHMVGTESSTRKGIKIMVQAKKISPKGKDLLPLVHNVTTKTISIIARLATNLIVIV